MANIILDGKIANSVWSILRDPDGPVGEHALVSLPVYLNSPELQQRPDVGVWVAAEDAIHDLTPFLSQLRIIAVDFPAFTDGRALSHAHTLRVQLGYSGELRAIVDVRRDKMEQMARCGINAFELADDADLNGAVAGLNEFTYSYQSSANRSEPLFRTR